MTIKQLVEQTFLDSILTTEVEERINLLLWSNQFDTEDISALDELVVALQLNEISVPNYSAYVSA
ncbi:MAG: hypothetical protein AB4040_21405 [Synechococcus sp.]